MKPMKMPFVSGFSRPGLIVSITLLVAYSAVSQIAGGMNETTATNLGGRHFITGTVFLPSGTPAGSRMRIRLSSMKGEIVTTTDETGKFVFSGVSNGTYTVSVDQDDQFETATSEVEIQQSRAAQSQPFNVMLRLRSRIKASVKPSVLKAENAGVPQAATTLYEKAIGLSKKGDHKEAVEQLKLALAAYPHYLLALNELGVQLIKMNQLDEADGYLQAALKIKPDAYEPLVNRGILLVRLKRNADAETELRKALSVNDTAIVHFFLGRVAAGNKKFDAAENEFTLSLTMGGEEMKEAHRMLASISLEKGDDKRALAELETYLKLAPNAPDADKLRETVDQLRSAVQKP